MCAPNTFFLNKIMILLIVFVGATFFQPEVSCGLDVSTYYPLDVGNVWSYSESSQDEAHMISKEHVFLSTPYLDTNLYLMGNVLDTGCWSFDAEAVFWDNEGLKFVGEIECEEGKEETVIFDEPIMFFPRYMDIGETKQWSYTGLKYSASLIGYEPVNVQAGTFEKTLRARQEMMEDDMTETCDIWFVQGLGSVKEECSFREDGSVEKETMEEWILLS